MVALAVTAAIIIYFFPSIVAISRSVPNAGSVIVLNVFLGWTFIGWVMSLAMSFRSARFTQQVNVNVAHQLDRPPHHPSATRGGYGPPALPSTPPPYYAAPQWQPRPAAGMPYNTQSKQSAQPQYRHTTGYIEEPRSRDRRL